jgi:hypothetical protein
MNRLFVILATLLATCALVPSANAVGDSAFSIVGSGTLAIPPGSVPGCLGPTQVTSIWIHACTAGTFTVTFTEVTSEVEVTVNGQAELLTPGVAYTFSDFTGQLTIQRTAGTDDYIWVINGAGTISS